MKQIVILLLIFNLNISCENKKLPIDYACVKFNEADSIINNYKIEDSKNEFTEFSTLFGFKLCVNDEFNKKKYQEYIKANKIKDSLIYLNNRINPFYISFEKINNKICEINFHSFLKDKYLTYPDNYILFDENNRIIEKANKELEFETKDEYYSKATDKPISLTSDFDNLFSGLIKKYGNYNFTESNDFTKNVYKEYDDEVKYRNYYWIIQNTLITLKYDYFKTNKKFRNYEVLQVETKLENIYLIYENITLNKQKKALEIVEYQNELKKENQKENAKKIEYKKISDSLNKNDKREIEINL